MKNTGLLKLGGIILLVIAIALIAYRQGSSSKLAYIDTAKLLDGLKEMQDLKAKLKVEQEAAKLRVDTLTMEFESSLKQHEKSLSKMNANEKRLSQELLRTKQSQLMQYQEAIGQKMQQEEQQKMGDVMKKVNVFITEYGKAKGYKIIFATSNGNIAYADETIDITAEIIKGLGEK